ncbi:uncharacterized protein L203_101706 [Cryptococcus depauperatus CBS 7841]|uniref:Zn(2)-C6 fungal-type domain-containing protein n=1 Tax=Cryptococcus depauperatus CBS 7841 TaxID=1295531 RepID=A0AAJ8JQJ4_9TREE
MTLQTALKPQTEVQSRKETSTAGAAKRSRRRTGPFKRSKTGCGTCKRRGKKCDEDWTSEGHCQRCIIGQFECTGRTLQPPKKPRQTSEGLQSQEQQKDESYEENCSLSSSQAQESDHHFPQLQLPSIESTAYDSIARPLLPHNKLLKMGSRKTQPPVHDPTSFLTIHQFQNLFDWTSLAGSGHEALLASTTECGSLGLVPLRWAEDVKVDESTPGSELLSSGISDQQYTTPNASDVQLNGLRCEKHAPMVKNGVPLGSIYSRLMDAWIPCVPSNTRERVRSHLLSLNEAYHSLRNTKYALASFYLPVMTSALAKSSFCNELPVTTRKASGLPPLYDQTAAFLDSSCAKETESSSSNSLVSNTRLRILRDILKTVENDKETIKWIEDAIKELNGDNGHKKLSDMLWAVINLHLLTLLRTGASFSHLSLGDQLPKIALGSNHPVIELSSLRGVEQWSLRLFAIMDVGRCVVERGRRTIFDFTPGVLSHATYSSVDDEGFPYLGIPDAILILLAKVVNLCADALTLNRYSVNERADELEKAIRGWQSPSINAEEEMMEKLIIGELWRWSTLVVLYQSIHKVGSLHPVLLKCQSQLLSLLSCQAAFISDSAPYISLPAFLAATLSSNPQDRAKSMEHLRRLGPEKVWLDNIVLVEKVWEEVDKTGNGVDWWGLGRREGLSLVFF